MTVITPWSPVKIGACTLDHRVVLAPLTRGRASPSERTEKTWVPNDLMNEYYTERATQGGLLITEATPVSLEASSKPGIPGMFTQEQRDGWAKIVDSVHAKGASIFSQAWHQGRSAHSYFLGTQPVSSSDVAADGNVMWGGVSMPCEKPRSMTVVDIERTQSDFINAAKNARSIGFDGVEIHAGNGYLFDQFHHSNVNLRTDSYGGDMFKRCKFTLETIDKMIAAIGSDRLAVRLTPFGLFNDCRGEQRMEQWLYLCSELSKRNLAYVHLIEPRFDEFRSASEKASVLGGLTSTQLSLAPFRQALGSTPMIAAGGFGPNNLNEGLARGDHDLVAFGRFFCANPDLVERLKNNQPLYKWDRSRFYGPFEDNKIGYTVHVKREIAGSGEGLKAQFAD